MEEERNGKKTGKKSRLAFKIIAFVLIAVIAGAGTGVIMNMIPRTEKTAPVEIVENPNAAIRVSAEEEHYIFDVDLYDQVDKIPFDKIEEFFNTNLK